MRERGRRRIDLSMTSTEWIPILERLVMMEGPVICCPHFPRYTFLQAEACFCLGRKFRSSPRDVARNFRLNQRSWTDFSGLLQNFWILWTESISHVDFSKANSLLHFDISKKKKKEISIYDRIVNVISTCLERAGNIFHREPIKRKNKKCERVSHEISTREKLFPRISSLSPPLPRTAF